MKHTTRVLAVMLLLALPVSAQEADEDRQAIAVTGADQLVEESGTFQATWINPDAEITNYKKLFMWSAVFQFRDVDDRGGTTTQMLRNNNSGPFTISEESRARFEEVVFEAISAELARTNIFEMTDQLGPNTLLVRAGVLDIISNVPPNVGRAGNIHFNAVGEATMVFELIDAETGVIQARVAERRRIQPRGRMNDVSGSPTTAATVWNDVQRWAREEARTLRRELEKAMKRATK